MSEKMTNAQIQTAFDSDPTKGSLMLLGVMENQKVEKMENGEPRTPFRHDSGWHFTIETSGGLVGLWSCWLEDRFFLAYPLDVTIPDVLVMETLGLQPGFIVEGDLYGRMDRRQWAEFCSERVEGKGRIWIQHRAFDPYGVQFPYISEKRYEQEYYGHNYSKNISIVPFGNYSKQYPDAPTLDTHWIQSYRNAFLDLLLKVARQTGKIQAVNVKYELTVIAPEQLEAEGYQDIQNISEGLNRAWYARRDKEEIVLTKGNFLVPWSCLRRIQANDELSVEHLLDCLLF